MEGLEWGKGGEEPKKGGFPGPRLPVSNVQVPKFSWRSGGPIGIWGICDGNVREIPPSVAFSHPFPCPSLLSPVSLSLSLSLSPASSSSSSSSPYPVFLQL